MDWMYLVIFIWGFLIGMGVFIRNRGVGNFILAATIGGPLLYGTLSLADYALGLMFDYFNLGTYTRIGIVLFLFASLLLTCSAIIAGIVIYRRKNPPRRKARSGHISSTPDRQSIDFGDQFDY